MGTGWECTYWMLGCHSEGPQEAGKMGKQGKCEVTYLKESIPRQQYRTEDNWLEGSLAEKDSCSPGKQ